jgi:preprotein translocase subunit YajC
LRKDTQNSSRGNRGGADEHSAGRLDDPLSDDHDQHDADHAGSHRHRHRDHGVVDHSLTMSTNDRTILLVIPLVAALVAFWFLLVAPKRDEAKKLDDQVTQLQTSVSTQEVAIESGKKARKDFPRDYHRLVVLGKAVPADDETASFLVQIQRIANDTGIEFRAIKANSGGAASTTTPAPATEGSAALLPIGASVGAAGLPTMPYTLTFTGGNFFQIADFIDGLDRLVNTKKGRIASDGRLVTINSFDLAPSSARPFPIVLTTLDVTTYVTPADQGVTAGATPTGPSTTTTVGAPATTTAPTTPTSSTVPPAQ